MNGNGDSKTSQPEKKINPRVAKIWGWSYNYLLKPSTLGVLVLFGLLLVVLFIPPVIGMADDGSTAAIISGSNLYNLGELSPKEATAFFQKDWGIMAYFNDTGKAQAPRRLLF